MSRFSNLLITLALVWFLANYFYNLVDVVMAGKQVYDAVQFFNLR